MIRVLGAGPASGEGPRGQGCPGPEGTRPLAGRQLPDCFSVATSAQWACSPVLTHVEPQTDREDAGSLVFMGQRDVNTPNSRATAGTSSHHCWAVAGATVKDLRSVPRMGTEGWPLVTGECPATLGERVLGL